MGRSKTPEKPVRKNDQATQTVAAILQEFARHSFDIDDRFLADWRKFRMFHSKQF